MTVLGSQLAAGTEEKRVELTLGSLACDGKPRIVVGKRVCIPCFMSIVFRIN